MPTKTPKNPFVVSGSPVLVLVLIAIVTMVRHGGATTSSGDDTAMSSDAPTVSPFDVCDAEAEACADDPECSQCRQGWVFADEYVDKLNECRGSGWESTSQSCGYFSMDPCCHASLSFNGAACLVNSAYVEYWNCYTVYISAGECSTWSCDNTNVDVDATAGVGSSSPSALLTVPGLACLAAALILAVLL